MTNKPVASPSTTISTLPDPLPEGVPYSVPEEVKRDAGDLFAYICAICYGHDSLPLADHFGVSRQTFWVWRKTGKGVPDNYRDEVEALLAKPKSTRFRLPTNAVMEDIMRAPRGPSIPVRHPKPNHHLIDLFHRICANENMGHGTLNTIISQMSRPVSNPYVFYRWAWSMGGVPRSYVSAFLTALMQLRIYELYDYSQSESVNWEAWAERVLAAPHEEPITESDKDAD